MDRGALLIAHNTGEINYYSMAVNCARRIHRHLGLPVSIITDKLSATHSQDTFHHLIYTSANSDNYRGKNKVWSNKNRYMAYEASPYYSTLLIDVDYVVNSQTLLTVFDHSSDFICHNTVRWIFNDGSTEYLGNSGIPILWATVIKFDKTPRARGVFQMMEMVQENYAHYSEIYGFQPYMYRNDYALTVAHKTLNGHIHRPEDHFHWPLVHVNNNVKVVYSGSGAYTLLKTVGSKRSYITVKDIDFHMLSKSNFLELPS